MLFLVLLGDLVYGPLQRNGMTRPHLYGAVIVAFAGMVFGIISVGRSFKFGTGRAVSIIATVFGGIVFVGFGGVALVDLAFSSRSNFADVPPSTYATPSGPIRVSFPANL